MARPTCADLRFRPALREEAPCYAQEIGGKAVGRAHRAPAGHCPRVGIDVTSAAGVLLLTGTLLSVSGRLRAKWQAEYDGWAKRPLGDRGLV